MPIFKIVGAILTIGASTGIGFYFSQGIKHRIEELKSLRKLILILRGEIRYAKTPLPEAIGVIGRRSEGVFKEFFKEISDVLEESKALTLKEIWGNAVDLCLKKTSISKQEKEELKELGNNLGYLDYEMQLNMIDLYIEQLDSSINELENSKKEKSKLYNCLGIIGGIFITIVIY